jgi:hypothetical protein
MRQTPARFLPFKSRGVSWDRYARKGALYTQLEFEGKAVDLMTVHLQAGYCHRFAPRTHRATRRA